MAKLMRMKGPNGLRPCRTCKILGISGENNTHYVPCFRHDGEFYDPLDLPLRTHDEFIDDAVSVEKATTNAEAERRAKDTGINGLPVLATLSSLEFPASFGHDLMHLIPENKLDVGTGDYILQPKVVEDIGRNCVAAGDTTPTAFGARVPNIATQLHYFTAESYTLWTTLLAPVVLRGRFPHKRYYDHFLGLVDIFNDCLSMSLSREYVDNDLRARIGKWVTDYERYYYQYDESRLSACPLTIHALLHIPDDILNGGPMWTYWNYITESFSRRLREIAQNTAIKVKYQLYTELDLSPWHEEELSGHVVAGYNGIRVLRPRATGPLSNRLTTAVAYGQLLRLLEFTIALPPECDTASCPLLLAAIRPVKEPKKSPYPFPVYQDGQFRPIEVIDVDDLSCLVARVPANRRGPLVYALYEHPDSMGSAVEAE
ncbi:hypothetical protein MIND_00412300 [Mycena indigotica]|uniref:Uncharacterized protein n=1 Tax=Mycena indigotica TaxID=2126181 RepID=A0A8H6SVU2_9AGAR|nr:uncharacterized protein MIND_00412300 [Mycena indigotica]KAF7306218.1 hypothetical protein MIND_00412300 [Mycena indigotica]